MSTIPHGDAGSQIVLRGRRVAGVVHGPTLRVYVDGVEWETVPAPESVDRLAIRAALRVWWRHAVRRWPELA